MSDQRRSAAASAATFLGAGGLLVAYAVDGGTYDVVVRQQFGLILWWVVFLLAAFGLVAVRRPGWPVALVLMGLAGLAVWTAVSFSWSGSDERTLIEVSRTLHHLGLLVVVLLLAGRERWPSAAAGASAAAAVVCGLALGSRLAPGTFGEDATARALGTDRLSSPFGYWNAAGAWAAMTVVLMVGWAAHARTLPVRALALAATPACVLAGYLTYSRASVGDLAIGLLVVIALAPRRWTTALCAALALGLGGVAVLVTRGHHAITEGTGTDGAGTVVLALAACALAGALGALLARRTDELRLPPRTARTAVIAGGALALVTALVLSATVLPQTWRDFKTPYSATVGDPAARLTNLNGSRYQIWASALDELRAAPLKGSGAGTFEFTWSRDGKTGEFVRDAHSLLLEPFSELGIPGGLLVLLTLAGIVAIVATARRHAPDARTAGAVAAAGGAAAAWLVAASVDWMWEATAVTALMLVLVGSVGASILPRATRTAPHLRIGLAVLALLAAATMIPPLVSTSRVRDSQRAAARGDLAEALSAARDAEAAQPWAATPRLQLGLLAERLGDLPAARAQLVAARDREPANWRLPLILSRILAEEGDVPAALASYRQARALRPRAAIFELQPLSRSTPRAGRKP